MVSLLDPTEVADIEEKTAGYLSHSARTILDSLERATTDESGLSPVPGGAPFSVNYRTLGNVAYFMLSLNTPPDVIRSVEDSIWGALTTPRN